MCRGQQSTIAHVYGLEFVVDHDGSATDLSIVGRLQHGSLIGRIQSRSALIENEDLRRMNQWMDGIKSLRLATRNERS